MKLSNSEISFYTDTIVVETILRDNFLIKNAETGLISGLIDKIKQYVESHIDPNDKAGSIINILAPGALFVALRAMGFGWLSVLISLSINVFHIDVKSILNSIYEKIKSMVEGDKQVSSAQIDNAVMSSIKEHSTEATEEEVNEFLQSKSFSENIRNAKWIKLAMVEFKNGNIEKQAGILSLFSSKKAKTTSILAQVLSWIFKIALASAGLMVAGDAVNKFIDRKEISDGKLRNEKPSISNEISAPKSIQTKFKLKQGYTSENYNVSSNWMINVSNDKLSIENMLVNFTKEVYDGLEGKENNIKSSNIFQDIVDSILFYNHTSPGATIIFIPPYFHSKKQMVDYYIDEIANKS